MSTASRAPHSSGGLDSALLVLRVALGAVFIAHGGQKLFWFGIAGTTEAFTGMGVFLPALTAPAVSIVEFFGGIAVLVGLFTRPAAAGIAVIMLGAIVMVHLPNGFFLPDGIEFAMMNFAVAVSLMIVGGGAYSLDAKRASARADVASAGSATGTTSGAPTGSDTESGAP